ncbi:crotonase/enoyl-CoA hydratase family protein [Phenylobacterium sp.]|uniref:crotonase/enoyl-CoA hydratase family protein n=1 Tax=Phenylobacterium sp. TaxID=1871053 RepID=UPI0035AFCAC4
MEERIKVEITNGVADVRLVRSDKMNALDPAMFAALVETGEKLKTTAGLRAIVLSGEGRAFCAGLDMSNFGKMASGERKAGESSAGGSLVTPNRTAGGSNHAQHAVMVWREQPVPVIGAIHGVAFGGGFQLAIAPDIRIVAPDTKMAVMEIKWGLVPDMAGMVLMKGMIRDDIARELTYTGRIFDGEEAGRIGVATKVTADPLAEALKLANEIAGKSPTAIRAAKRLFELQAHATQHALLEAESVEQTALISSPNQVEAVMSNMQKRAAVYAD